MNDAYEQGASDAARGINNCPYPEGTDGYRDYYKGHFNATEDGE